MNEVDAHYLAIFDNYPLTRKNSRFDLHILQFRLAVFFTI